MSLREVVLSIDVPRSGQRCWVWCGIFANVRLQHLDCVLSAVTLPEIHLFAPMSDVVDACL